MAKIRVYQLAKQLEISNKDLLLTLRELGLEVKSHMSVVDEETAEKIAASAKTPPSVVKDSKAVKKAAVPRADKKTDKKEPKTDKKEPKTDKKEPKTDKEEPKKDKEKPKKDKEKPKKDKEKPKKPKKEKKKAQATEPPPEVEEVKPPVGPIALSEGITVKELSERLGVKVNDVIKSFMKKGKMMVVNQFLDFETAKSLVEEMGFQCQAVSLDDEGQPEEAAGNLSPRAPVVTIMGHVDHGKTSLLDVIRESSLIEKESGGITQHIGAYHVEHPKGTIVFLDTPGHAAFTAMRSRGAKVTDIVILVVAADDGVMPQTLEAIDHAKAAEVPIIVAVNKIDKPDAKPDTVRTQLAEHDLLPEDWGGQTIFVEVSAKKKIGLETLLEMILLQAEVMELKANPNKPCRGTVIESKLDRGRGPVATVLVQDGTLRTGDYFVTGTNFGRVRAILNEKGAALSDAPPITPVEILGLSGVPAPGDSFQVVSDERKARQVAALRLQQSGPAASTRPTRLSLKDLFSKISKGEAKELPLVVKGDVQGSVEALSASLVKLSTEKVKVRVIHRGVGTINEGDILLASASSAVIIGFNVRPEPKVSEMALREGLDMRFYNIIYKATEDIQKAMLGLLDPTYREEAQGRAEVRDTFSVPRIGIIAGCGVLSGKMVRNAEVRIIRDGVVVYEGRISSLRRFKDDAKEVGSGYECGVGVSNFNDIKKGDIIESFIQVEEKPTL